jgi:hypothetical protein
MHSTIDAQLPQKVPKRKTCLIPRKWVISDYPLLNCITAKKMWKSLYSITTKSSESLQNPTYKIFKEFFLYLKLFSCYTLSKTRFWPSTQSLLRHFGSIFTFKTNNSKTIWRIKNCLKVVYAICCTFSDDATYFIVIEYKISHFFAVIQFNRG